LLAPRERSRELAPPIGEPRKTLEGASQRFSSAFAAESADESEPEIVLDVQGREHRATFGRVGDPQADELPRRKTGDILTGEKIRPLVTGTSPVTTRAIVDLPAPFGPRGR